MAWYATIEQARDAYAGEEAHETRVRAVMASASGMVARLAPAPDPVPVDYPERAASSELIAGEYLWATGGHIHSETTGDLTTRYASTSASLDSSGVEQAVRDAMGSYAVSKQPLSGMMSAPVRSSFYRHHDLQSDPLYGAVGNKSEAYYEAEGLL